ncbi:MAG: glycosyltransferase family 2 protein [Nitrospirota bacterium]
MNSFPSIDILLATYNGEQFLDAQIQSILNQTNQDWRLIIRDDGSSDKTGDIICAYEQTYPGKIVQIHDQAGSLGACRNFGRLLEHSDADYTMFCDQDDVWLSKKIEMTFACMKQLEEQYGTEIPLLVYTDMKIVDHDLHILSDSFWKSQAFNPEIGKSLSRFLVSNVATGCTVMINRKLRALSLPIPPEALMHDWWTGLISVSLGKNDFVEEPTMLYRQHAENAVGARWDMRPKALARKIMEFKQLKAKTLHHLAKTQKQAEIFAERYKNSLSQHDYEKLIIYAGLDSLGFFKKRSVIIQNGFWWSGFIRSAVMFVIM